MRRKQSLTHEFIYPFFDHKFLSTILRYLACWFSVSWCYYRPISFPLSRLFQISLGVFSMNDSMSFSPCWSRPFPDYINVCFQILILPLGMEVYGAYYSDKHWITWQKLLGILSPSFSTSYSSLSTPVRQTTLRWSFRRASPLLFKL